ncbi:hypothetical protein [Brevundimonas sp. Bb-A]|uniref:hypothetical protein n=1 Tax=Brevundimonas sp. Bb-A TaxID=2560058 RepID=UPI001D152328|nr:hypothetical protein [Brevundimonas sp. Bb-A]
MFDRVGDRLLKNTVDVDPGLRTETLDGRARRGGPGQFDAHQTQAGRHALMENGDGDLQRVIHAIHRVDDQPQIVDGDLHALAQGFDIGRAASQLGQQRDQMAADSVVHVGTRRWRSSLMAIIRSCSLRRS